jgi:hypothetical protein
MGLKGKYQETEESDLLRWYQWEFLRRNEDYRRDVEAFLSEFKEWFAAKGFWYDRTAIYQGADWQFFCNVLCPRLSEICKKWQIHDVCSPEWNFSKAGYYDHKPRLAVCVPTGCTAKNAGNVWSLAALEGDILGHADELQGQLQRSTPPKIDTQRFVQVTFDGARTKKELLRQATAAIELARARYESYARNSGNNVPTERKPRRRFSEYQNYLRIWDLRKQGMTFEQIAEEVFPGQNAHQRAWDNYKRAEQLIQGEYKELR